MFAVGSAWATDPENTSESDTVATSHSDDIYPSGLGPITAADGITAALSQFKDSGIAGVTYVNRMVGVAGGAAQQAEDHAAAAGAYAIAAAQSADEAKSALDGKEDKVNKLKTTDTTTITNDNKDTLYPSVGKVQSMLPNTSYMGDTLNMAFTNGGGIQQRYKEVASIGQIQELTTTKIINSPMPWVRRDYVNKGLEIVPTEDYSSAELNVRVDPEGSLGFSEDGELKVLESADGAIGGVRKSTESYSDMLNVRDGVDTNSDGDYVPTTAQIRALQSEVANRVGWTQGAVANGVVTTDNSGNVSARSVGDTMVVNNGVLNAKTATASVPGVMKWGEVPSGSATSTTSAQIWIE